MTIKSIKYLSVAMLFAVSGCTYNQYTTTRGGYDDLYGGRYDDPVVVAGNRSSQGVERNGNPDFQGDYANEEVVDQYFDENYITARNIQRNNSNQVGYNAGFNDGFLAGRNAGFFGGMNSMWGYPGFNVGFGMGSMMGMGGMMGMGFGNPWGFNRWNRWGSFYDPYWNSMAWGWGDPFMFGGGFGHPFYGGFGGPFYNGFGFGGGMWGYNPYMWRNYYPVIVNNHYGEGVRTRNYGPRSSGNAVSRTAASGTRRDVGTTPSRSSARTSTGRVATGSDGYYTRPRTAAEGANRAAASTRNVSGARGVANQSGNHYYANPNSNRSSIYSNPGNARTGTAPVYRSSEGSRSSSSYSAPARGNSNYSAPQRNNNSAPQRNYSAPASTPSRSYSAPAAAPSRSYSAPSSGGGGVRSSGGGGGRGPR